MNLASIDSSTPSIPSPIPEDEQPFDDGEDGQIPEDGSEEGVPVKMINFRKTVLRKWSMGKTINFRKTALRKVALGKTINFRKMVLRKCGLWGR